MNTHFGSSLVGTAILVLLMVMANSLVMSFVAFFYFQQPTPAALMLGICSLTAGWLLKFCFEKVEH